jgi:hypothetical protein
MNAKLTYLMARQASAELQRAAERSRLASGLRADTSELNSAPPAPDGRRAIGPLEIEPAIGCER